MASTPDSPSARELQLMHSMLAHELPGAQEQSAQDRSRWSQGQQERRGSVSSRSYGSEGRRVSWSSEEAVDDSFGPRRQSVRDGRDVSTMEEAPARGRRGSASEPLSIWASEPVARTSVRRNSSQSNLGLRSGDEKPQLWRRGSNASLATAYKSSRGTESKLQMRLFLLDNSGSTKKEDGCVLVTEGDKVRAVETDRWCEIVSIAVVHAQWCGRHQRAVRTQFALLNPPCPREPREGRDFVTVHPADDEAEVQRQVEELSKVLKKNGPCGNTPLTSRLKQLRTRMMQELEGEPRLALTIVTDGLPTSVDSISSTDQDKEAFHKELQIWADVFACSPIIRLATGQTTVCKFYQRLGKEAAFHLGLVHDLNHEAQAAAAAGNGWLAYTPHLHWLRESGVLEGPLGVLTDHTLSFPEIVELLQWLFKKRLCSRGPKTFCEAVEKALEGAAPVYNGRLRRMSPPVDVHFLRDALGLTYSMAQLGRDVQGLARTMKKVPERRFSFSLGL